MRFGSLFILALPLVVACGGGGPDESVSGVFPSSAFLGRQVRVEISGDVTEWKAGASVNFGAGVTVQNVAVASPTALFADITVMDDAAPGLRDVTVESNGKSLVLKEAFQLESAISLKFRGTVAQGSIATFAINNHDFNTPFDTTSTGDGFFTPIVYTGTNIEAPAGVTLQVEEVTPYGVTGLAFFDLDAVAGPLVVSSGFGEDVTTSNLGTNLDVKARTATVLAAGTPASGMVEATWASALYEFTPTANPSLTTLATSSTSTAAKPGVAILGSSGRFEDMIGYSLKRTLVQLAPSKLYAVYVDTSGTFGYTFSVRGASQMLTQLAEVAEPGNDTPANAQALTAMPSLVTGATLMTIADVDWISITATAADVGKKIRVLTTGSDP
ncbi:MAG: hypothetical protein H0T65_17575, partial [Deltaproteobacteria bacterium]|nr:hypothetical protein [Deltaproteobacteria bacterium]